MWRSEKSQLQVASEMHPGSPFSNTVAMSVQGAWGRLSFLHLTAQYLKGKRRKKVYHVINRTFHQRFENVQSQPHSLYISSPRINLERGQFWQRADICQFFWQLPINTQKSLWGCYCQIIWIQWWVKDQKPIDKADV